MRFTTHHSAGVCAALAVALAAGESQSGGFTVPTADCDFVLQILHFEDSFGQSAVSLAQQCSHVPATVAVIKQDWMGLGWMEATIRPTGCRDKTFVVGSSSERPQGERGLVVSLKDTDAGTYFQIQVQPLPWPSIGLGVGPRLGNDGRPRPIVAGRKFPLPDGGTELQSRSQADGGNYGLP